MNTSKKHWRIYLGIIVWVLGAVNVSAIDYTWIGEGAGADWHNPANWNPEGIPSRSNPQDTVGINTLPGPTVYSGNTASAHSLRPGNAVGAHGGLEILSGAAVNATGLDVANVAGSFGTVNFYGGTQHTIQYLCPGFRGTGVVNMYDGYIRVTNSIRIAYYSTSTNSYLNLYGGTISAPTLSMRREGNPTGWLNITDGVLLLDGDKRSVVQPYLDNGWILVPNERYELVFEYNGASYPGVTALYTFYDLLDMIPRNHSTVPASTNQLQWTLPDPNDPVTPSIVTCDVHFGTDPNILLNPKIVSKQAVESASVPLAHNTVYYWQIAVYDSDINNGAVPYYRSRVFTFDTFNVPPTVDAGEDIQTWWVGAPRVVQLNGSVVDADNFPGPNSQTWTVLSEPDPLTPAVLSNPSILNPTITLNAVGDYTLQLEGSDGEYSITDTMQIVVYPDACEHASNQPGFAWYSADLNRNCEVDIEDLAEFAAQWLEWNYSIE